MIRRALNRNSLPALVLICLLAGWGGLSGQVIDGEGREEIPSTRIASLSALLNSIEAKIVQIDAINLAIGVAGNEVERAELLRKAEGLQSEKTSLERQFESVAGGLDSRLFEEQEPEPFDIQSEAIAILEPLFNELNRATMGPREVDQLEEELRLQASLAARAGGAVESLDALLGVVDDEGLLTKLHSARKIWTRRRDAAANQKIVLQNQLQTRLAERETVTDNLRRSFTSFLRSRGVHLLIGIFAFIAVYFLVRLIHRGIAKRMAKHRVERSIYARFIDVALHVLAFVVALMSLVLVFFITDDFVLLALTFIFIAGLAWGGIKLVPGMLDELRMVLNLGPVREGERVVYSGIPWRVDNLSFQTDLSNPELTGGKLTMPVRGLLDMQSRPFARDERWFPSKVGDWVRLESPPLAGEVICQTPEYVELRLLGGSHQTFPATAYLQGCPANLSDGFRVNRVFRISHEHRPEATSAIPRAMEKALREGLDQILDGEGAIVHLAARLQEAGESSLDYDIDVDFSGEAAPRHEELERHIVGILVDLANREGWKIPFQQITIHQADGRGG